MRTMIGKFLIISGLILVFIGGIVMISNRIPWLGRLPGDIYIKRDGFSFYFPIATSIIISIFLTIVINLIFRFLRRF